MITSRTIRWFTLGAALASFAVGAAEARDLVPACTDLFGNMIVCEVGP